MGWGHTPNSQPLLHERAESPAALTLLQIGLGRATSQCIWGLKFPARISLS